MKLAHLSDIHFCTKNLPELRRVIPRVLGDVEESNPDAIILSGDLFDQRLFAGDEALGESIRFLKDLSLLARVFVLQGTYSHDAPGMLQVLKSAMSLHEIHFVTGPSIVRPCALMIPPRRKTDDWTLDSELATPINPDIVVSHGTVFGALTEHDVPMAGVDHEFTEQMFWNHGARAWLLGHIHKHQVWTGPDGQKAAYAGSLGRYHHGERGDKVWLEWDITNDAVTLTPHKTGASESVTIEFAEPPGLNDLRRAAEAAVASAKHVAVRIRYLVDEEYKDTVDRKGYERVLAESGACDWRIEPSVQLVQTARQPGISKIRSVEEQLDAWAALSEIPKEDVREPWSLMSGTSDDEVLKLVEMKR